MNLLKRKFLLAIIVSIVVILILTIIGFYFSETIQRSESITPEDKFQEEDYLSDNYTIKEKINFPNDTIIENTYYTTSKYDLVVVRKNNEIVTTKASLKKNRVYYKNNTISNDKQINNNVFKRYQDIVINSKYDKSNKNKFVSTDSNFPIGFLNFETANNMESTIKFDQNNNLEELNTNFITNQGTVSYQINVDKLENTSIPNWILETKKNNPDYNIEVLEGSRVIRIENIVSDTNTIENIILETNSSRYYYNNSFLLRSEEDYYLSVYNDNIIVSDKRSDVIKGRIIEPRKIVINDLSSVNYTKDFK